MAQYKHPYVLVKLSKPKNNFDYFMNDVIKSYNQNVFKVSEMLSGITCVRRYSAIVYHRDFISVLDTRLSINEDEVRELEQYFNQGFEIDWSNISLVNEDKEIESSENVLNQLAASGLLPDVYVKYLQRLNDNLQLYQYHCRNTPYQVELDVKKSIEVGKANIVVSMCEVGVDPYQVVYTPEAKKFYKKDLDRKKFEEIAHKYPDLNFTIFKLLHRHIYSVLSTRVYPGVDLLELNVSPKKCSVYALLSPTELLSYDDKGDLEELVKQFAKDHQLHKEDMKRSIDVLKYEFGLNIANTQEKFQDEILEKDYLLYEISIK